MSEQYKNNPGDASESKAVNQNVNKVMRQQQARQRRHGTMGGGPPGMGGMAPSEKAKDFKGSLKRLLGYLKPQRIAILVVLIMAIVSVGFSISGPKIMENGIGKFVEGLSAKMQANAIVQMMEQTGMSGEQLAASLASTRQVAALVEEKIDREGAGAQNIDEFLATLDDPMAAGVIMGMTQRDGANIQDANGALKALNDYLKLDDAIDNVMKYKEAAGQDRAAFLNGLSEQKANGTLDEAYAVDFSAILTILLWMCGVYLLSALFSFFQQRIIAKVSRHVIYDLRKEVDQKLDRLPLSYFDNTGRGEVLSRVTNDVDNISSTLQQSMTQVITAVFTLIGVLIMMLTIDVWLTLLCMVTLPLVFIAMALIMKKSRKHFGDQWKTTGALNAHVEETITGLDIVNLYNREEQAEETFVEENEDLYQASFKAQFLSGIVMPLMGFLNNLNFVIICVVGGVQVAANPARFGALQAMLQYSRQFTQPIMQTASIMNVLQSTMASAERVFELLDETEESPEPLTPAVIENPKGAVSFEQVSFRYLEDKPLIENMTLNVKPGQRVAIVGPTGAGKTTLVNLLMRFYELNDGRINVDGVNIKDMNREDLRRQFGMVLQDTWLFGGTIRDNIAYGREGATEEEIKKAAKNASVDHFVQTLDGGYDTEINDDASNLSQGQKQLLAIARAFVADPNILILDEATSSVDTRTEVLIQKAMSKLLVGRTSFVIAHRLSTIRDADVILVMRDGAIVEQGKHEELLEAKGFYSELYMSQFAS